MMGVAPGAAEAGTGSGEAGCSSERVTEEWVVTASETTRVIASLAWLSMRDVARIR